MESDITQSAAFYKTWAWVDAHKSQVVIGVVAVLAVGLGVGIFITQKNQRQVTASQALSKIGMQNSLTGQPADPAAYEKIASEYPNTSAGARAQLIAGTRFFVEGKYPEAQAAFQKFLNEHPDSDFAAEGLTGVAASLAAQGKTAEAIKAYKDVSERNSTELIGAQAKLAIGRIYEGQGELTQARDTYQQIARGDLGTIGQEAAVRLRALLVAHPDLAKPATPAVVPGVATTNAPVLNTK